MEIYREEIFGPGALRCRVSSYAEAVALSISNEYGNGTAIFTNDGGAPRRFEHDVEVGMIGVNVPIPVPVAYSSFGGWKRSLFGDTHAHGAKGVHFFTWGKVVTSRWIKPPLVPPAASSLDSRRMTDAALALAPMDADRAYELDRRHVFHSWSAQALLDPMVIPKAEGIR